MLSQPSVILYNCARCVLMLGFKARNVHYKIVYVIVCQLLLHLLNRPYLFSSLSWASPSASRFLALLLSSVLGDAFIFVMNADTFVNKQKERLRLRRLHDRTCTPTSRAKAVAYVDLFKTYRSAVICIAFMLHDCDK